jgi:hypothetical protein
MAVGLDKAKRYRERMKRYVAALLVVLGLVGVVGVLAIGRGFADEENASRAKCSEATLHGTYLLAWDGVDITGNKQVPFAGAAYDVYDGNGKVDSVNSVNGNGDVIRKVHVSGTYTVKADCTGTSTFDGAKYDLFIAPDGSMFTWVQVKPSEQVTSGFELRATAKRVGP